MELHANYHQHMATLKLILFLLNCPYFCLCYSAFILNEVPNLQVWITISSLAHKDPSNSKNFLIRQVELNWINAPLEDSQDYIALYLDSEPDYNSLPVAMHKVNNQVHGMVTTDFYLPQLDFLNTIQDRDWADHYGDGGGRRERYQRQTSMANESSSESRHTKDKLNDQPARSANQQSYRQLLMDECLGYCLAYHSRDKILARNCFKTNPNWMAEVYQFIGSRSLPTIMLPGTHNSGTYQRFLDKSSLQHINKYQVNQEESIFNQLVYGIRHLDLRVGYSKVKGRHERLWIYHDIFRTEVSVEDVCQQVRRFLSLTSHEVIIMDFHRFTVGFQNQDQATARDHHDQLVRLITHHLGVYIIPSYLGYHAPLSEFVNAGRRLLIGYANKASIFSSPSANSITIGRQYPRTSLPADADPPTGSDSAWSSSASASDDRYPPMGSTSASNEAALFFSSVWHLWPNKDTLAGLAHYMNETTCRKYFGELRSMMAELTPSVFGAITDKYDGNRRLAQLVNRPVTDWIRDRWWHCINIVATDFFLGNDLIRLAIHSNRLRITRHNTDPNSYKCGSFRKIEHLLDKRSIASMSSSSSSSHDDDSSSSSNTINFGASQSDLDQTDSSSFPGITMIQTRSVNHHIYRPHSDKRPAVSGAGTFVDHVADGFSNLFTSFKRLLNL